eukprot:3414007-Amphidinium_carterae.1
MRVWSRVAKSTIYLGCHCHRPCQNAACSAGTHRLETTGDCVQREKHCQSAQHIVLWKVDVK